MSPAGRSAAAPAPHRRRLWAAAGLCLLLAAGAALRLLQAFPSHKYANDADCALSALCAFKVLRGHHPVFVSEVRIGSLVGFETAALFRLFGISRDSFALEAPLVGLLLLGAWYLFLRETLGPRLARLGLLFAAIPAPAFAFWTSLPTGYPETVMLCAAAFWLAARLAVGEGGLVSAAGLGLVAGLGWWNSLQTLGCTVPALLWMGWSRPALLRRRGLLPLLAGGFLAGAFPWIAYNLHHPLASFQGNFTVEPVRDVAAAVDNARVFFVYDLPELVAGIGPLLSAPERPPWPWLRLPVVATIAAAALFFLAGRVPVRRRSPVVAAGRAGGGTEAAGADAEPDGDDACRRQRAVWPLCVLTVLAVLGLLVVSAAGARRGLTARYVLPLYLLVPVVLAVFLAACARRSRLLAGALAALVLAFNLRGVFWPWTPARQAWASDARAEEQLLATLYRQRIGAVCGTYWDSYALNFLSRERLRGVPLEPETDQYWEGNRLPASPVRWALVDRQPQALAAWAASACLAGTMLEIPAGAPRYALFLPAANPPPGETPHQMIDRLRRSYIGTGGPCGRPSRRGGAITANAAAR